MQDIPAESEFLPKSIGNGRPRPHVPVDGAEPAGGGVVETMLRELMNRLPAYPGRGPSEPALIPEKLKPSEERDWRAYQWAIEQRPALAGVSLADLFRFLQQSADSPFAMPPTFDTFRRRVSSARLFYEGPKGEPPCRHSEQEQTETTERRSPLPPVPSPRGRRKGGKQS